VAIFAAAGLMTLACGGGGGGGSASKGEIDIGVDLPLTGGEASNGVPTLNGVKFAVQQINANGGVKGYTLGVVSLDDAVNGVHNPQKGAQNIAQLVSNPKVLSEVGPFNSSVAQVEIPVANRASLTMISPANTNPCLTKEYPSGGGCATYAGLTPSGLRPSGKNNYFRVAGTDDYQGPANADYLYNKLGLRNVAVADDVETYGKGIAVAFANAWKKMGGTVVIGPQDIDPTTTSDFRTFLTDAKSKGAQAIYWGGVDANKVCVARSQMKGIFPDGTPFAGGDGIVSVQCLNDAADQATGMYGTIATKDPNQIPEAKDTIAAFKKQFTGGIDFGAYTIPAYAATQIEAAAIGNAIDANNGNVPTREQVAAEVAKTSNVATALGAVSFDPNGDIKQQIMTEYQSKGVTTPDFLDENTAKSAAWYFVQSKDYSGTAS
jgi:branched-chain amino acid transport system substrate-binding protein